METKEYEKQLNVKEVRIGNIVYGSWDDQDEDGEDVIRYSLCKITGVDENGELGEGWSYMLENLDRPETDYYNGLYGIELTEDWLLKFGFDLLHKGKFRNVYDYSLDHRFGYSDNHGLVHVDSALIFVGNTFSHIKYVHQLQNLFHSLTGEELKIKES